MIWESHRHTALTTSQADPLSYVRRVIEEYEYLRKQRSATADNHPIAHEVPAELTELYDAVHEPLSWSYTLYNGELGALWGYHYLCKQLGVQPKIDLEKQCAELEQGFLSNSTPNYETGLFFGLSGILLFRYLINPSNRIADQIFQLTLQHARLISNELFWGESACALCCLHMYRLSQEARWLDLYQEICASMIYKLEPAPDGQHKIWKQFLDGVSVYHLGAAHGYAGNAHAILASQSLLPDFPARDEFFANTVDVLAHTRLNSDTCCNWAQSIGTPRPHRTAKLVQWCHGAPGIVTSLAGYQSHDPAFERMLEQAANMTWQAGPLSKSVGGICHGTAGNGYAFLFMYRRTGDAMWLDKAQQFCDSAIASSLKTHEKVGQFKHRYWVGDIGTAVFAADCALKNTGILTLDKVN